MAASHFARWIVAFNGGALLGWLASAVAVRGFIGRSLDDGSLNGGAASLRALLDTRLALAGGIALCLATALGMVVGARSAKKREEERGRAPSPPANDEPRLGVDARDGEPTTSESFARIRRRVARAERIAARREVARQVAHEIKNPLAPIQASIETLRRLKDRNSPDFEDYFDEATRTVLAEVRRISAIVQEFSSFARMPEPRFERLRLSDVLRNVTTLFDSPHVTGGNRVRLDVRAEPLLVGDEHLLTQLFTNLVKNGIEAAEAAGNLAQISIVVELASNDEIRVLVRDNGGGVEPTIRERLFEPSVTTKRDGSGLGLAIVQTIAHEHGGDVRLVDDTPDGATFEVSLAVRGPAHAEEPTTTGGSDSW